MQLAHITYQLGENNMPLSLLTDNGELSPNEKNIYAKLLGLQQVPRTTKNHGEQLTETLQIFFKEYPVNVSKIRYLLYAHTADFVSPINQSVLSQLKTNFNLHNAICFESSLNKCASAFHLIQLSNYLLQDKQDNYSMILIADNAFTSILQKIPGSTVLGDAAAILLFSTNNTQHHYLDCEMIVDDRFSKGLWGNHAEQILFQAIYIDTVCQLMSSIIQRNHLTFSNIKYIFPHNVNTLSWKQVAEKLNVPITAFYLHNVDKTAHCFGADPFINLRTGILSGCIQPGDYYLLVTVGLGATFAALLFQY